MLGPSPPVANDEDVAEARGRQSERRTGARELSETHWLVIGRDGAWFRSVAEPVGRSYEVVI